MNDTAVFQNLSNPDCMRSYGNSLLSGKRNLLAVTSNMNTESPWNNSVLSSITSKPNDWYANTTIRDPAWWIYAYLPARNDPNANAHNDSNANAIQNTVNDAINNATAWRISGLPVDYCWSEIVPESYKLQFSSIIMTVVISCNMIKMFCLIFTLSTSEESGLTTFG